MKFYLRRILICGAAAVALLPSTIAAQKKNIPVDKPVASPRIPTDDKSKTQTAPQPNLSKLELAVIEEINQARRDPQKFVGYLEEYRKATKGDLISLPNRTPMRMVEGAPVIDEAMSELKTVSDLPPFEISAKLSDAARMQLKDLQEDSTLGHTGKNGSTLKMRLAQFVAVEGKSAENICHRGKTARDVAMIFLIDDGVKSRMHRRNLLNPKYKKIGVACGVGKNNDSLCVTVFAESYKELNAAAASHVEF